MALTKKDLDILNSKQGLLALLHNEKFSLTKTLGNVHYEEKLNILQEELIRLQHWVVDNNKRVVIVFEGRDAAGKGGAIRRFTEFLNPREYRVVALPKPDENEATQWYFQRYINQLPRAGEIVFFDRSWYNRAVVEPVNGFCSDEEYQIFMGQVNNFEKMLVETGTILIKLYFSITKKEQQKRFKEIIDSPTKRWKYSAVDQRALSLWEDYTKYKEQMFEHTNTSFAPWKIISANKKTEARIEAMQHVLSTIPYNLNFELNYSEETENK